MTKKEWICFFKDHNADEMGNCDRCGMDYNDWIKTLAEYYYNVRFHLVRWFQRFIYDKCLQCGKTEVLLGKQIGNHDKCLPF